MRRFTLGAVAALALPLLGPSAGFAQSQDQAVVQVVVDLFDGMRERDEQKLRSVFVEGARLTGPATDEDGNPTLRVTPIEQFIEGILSAPPERFLDERIYNPEVRIDGNLATVWVEYDLYVGSEFSHCGVDAFQLAQMGEEWKIFQIADTRRREGCPSR